MTQEGYYVVGNDDARRARTTKITDPADVDSVSDRPERRRHDRRPAASRRTVATLSLAKFPNDAGPPARLGQPLRRLEQLRHADRSAPAGTTGIGLITPGAIEMSNVDLAQEFTNMITAQRGFQANSRVISTADEMLQELVNLKR